MLSLVFSNTLHDFAQGNFILSMTTVVTIIICPISWTLVLFPYDVSNVYMDNVSSPFADEKPEALKCKTACPGIKNGAT